MTESLSPEPSGIARAADILAGGGLVAFPTETVYGLGADAASDRAVAAIFAAKGRPRFNPLIAHLANADAARRLAVFGAMADRLAAAFWPGPLTLVLPLAPGAALSPLVTAGQATVALRVPSHPVARALLAAFDGPLAAPSANPSGRVSPTRAAHVHAGLGGAIAAAIDGGDCRVGVESTIVGLAGDPVLLRPGGLPAETVEACLGRPLAPAPAQGTPSAPGQLAAHYAPDSRLRLQAAAPQGDELWLGFGPEAAGATLNLSPSGDLVEAAANLFHHLRKIDDRAGGRTVAVSPIPDHGLGRAINDRLARAATPRPPEGATGG